MKSPLAGLTIALLLTLVIVPPAWASGIYDDRVIFGGNFTLEDGETIDGDLVVFGGNAVVEEGATVTGDIVIFGGAIDIGGQVNGSIVIFGGSGSLEDTAEIDGDLVSIGGGISKATGAIVHGGESYGYPTAPDSDFVRDPARALTRSRVSGMFGDVFDALVWSVGLGLMALLAFLFIPEQLNRVAHATTVRPLAAGGLGIVTIILAPLVAFVLTITVIFIPLTVLGMIVFGIALLFSWLAIGSLVGQRMLAASVVRGTSPAVAAAIGVFVLTLVFRILQLAPGFGFLFTAFGGLVLSAGLGAVIMTRFGSRSYAAQPAIAESASISTTEPTTTDSDDEPSS